MPVTGYARHHDIKRAPAPQRWTIPVRRVVDFTPSRVQRRARPSRGLYRKVSRFIGSLSVLLALVSFGPWGHTISFYNDKEVSNANTFTAGLVDFVLSDTPFASVASTTDWTVDVTPNDLSNPFYYYASSSDFFGDLPLCEALTVTATLDGEVMFDGLLTELRTGTTTVIDTWVFDFNDFEAFAGQSCKFFVDYNGWQTRHDMDEGGYSDTERVMYTITVPSLLLAKVYFTTGQTCDAVPTAPTTTISASTTSCVDTQTWVELYNRTDADIDTDGWQLCSGDSCFTITDSQYIDTTVIKAGEFGIVAADPEIHTQISLPLGVTPLITDGPWFVPNLDPAGDMLQLRDPDDLVIDQMNWGQLNLGWANFTSDLWPSNSLTATSGAALARVPIGFDSNEPDDWVLLDVPTITIDSVAPALLEPGATTTVTYTAVNMNGFNQDLQIDIYLFEPDDTLHVVELDVENSGEYTFTIPADLEGPVRFKIVATSPENILLNARAVTPPLPVGDACDVCSSGSSVTSPTSPTAPSSTASTTPVTEVAAPASTTPPQAPATPLSVLTATTASSSLTTPELPALPIAPAAPTSTTAVATTTTPEPVATVKEVDEAEEVIEVAPPDEPEQPAEPSEPVEPEAIDPPTAPAATEPEAEETPEA